MEEEQALPGIRRRAFDTHGATVTEYRFDPGAAFPQHQHPEEQVMLVQEGAVAFTVAGTTHELGAGEWCAIDPNVEHGLSTQTGARVLALVVPRRAAPPQV